MKHEIIVKPAVSETEFEKVIKVRHQGYKKYFPKSDDVIDNFDYAPNVILFLATNLAGEPIGTMRVLDRRTGRVELDDFLNIDLITHHKIAKSCVEATRFSVPKHPNSKEIKLSLYIAYYLYIWHTSAKAGIIWARKSAAREYRRMLFETVGDIGKFKHQKLLDKEHETYILKCPVGQNHPFFSTVHDNTHSNIEVPKMIVGIS